MDKKSVIPSRKTPRKSSQTRSTVLDLTEELLKWICERHATNGPLDRRILREKALDLASSLGVTRFKCSDSWLTVFLKKHGFSPSLTNCSGPTFPDYRVWVDLLRSLITQYRHKDLFNVDELVMYSDFVPGRIFSNSPNHQQHSNKVDKLKKVPFSGSQTKRIGMLMCCNSSGTEKLRPLISGPYHQGTSRNDCHYHRNQESHIPDNVFADWLLQLNQDMAKSNRKILLLLNRDRICASQKVTQLSHINLLYFPKDFPAQLRPLRGDVFHCVKMTYRSRYVQLIRSADTKKQWGADEIIESIVQAWNTVTQELIVASFQRTKIRKDESFLKIECPAWDDLRTGISFKKFVTFDDELSEQSGHLTEDLELLARGNRHRYNLRKSKGTVDLDDSGMNYDDPRRGTRQNSGRIISKKAANQESQLIDKAQGSSGLKKRRNNISEDSENDSDTTEAADEDTSSNDDSQSEGFVDRIQDFLEDDISYPVATSVGEPSSSRDYSSDEIINMPYEKSQKIRVSNVRDMDYDGKSSVVENHGKDCLRFNSVEEVFSNSKEDELKSGEQNELVVNFSGEAGPSGKELYDCPQSFGNKNTLTEVKEFDDKDQTPDSQELKVKIQDAIECCDNIETFEDDGDLGQSNIDQNTSFKRTGEHNDGEEEPPEKRAKTDSSWSKRYETNFVFGPDHHDSGTNQSIESSIQDNQETVNNYEPATKSKKTQTRNSEVEKRCIFTLEGTSAGISFPTTKD